jgi:excisionase family DNA binding protein
MQPPEVMTIDELAEYLKVSKSSLYKLAQQGKVPGQKVGKHWRFSKQAIDDWISASSGELRFGQGDQAERGGRT